MSSLILATATRFLMPLLLLLSVFILLRGHNEPGGGFVAGLVASSAFSLYAVAHGVKTARKILAIDPRGLFALGLSIAGASGCLALAAGQPFLKGMWLDSFFPVTEKIGTPLVFDCGVYLAVTGAILTVIFALAEE